MAFHLNIHANQARQQRIKSRLEQCDYVMMAAFAAIALAIVAVLHVWHVF